METNSNFVAITGTLRDIEYSHKVKKSTYYQSRLFINDNDYVIVKFKDSLLDSVKDSLSHKVSVTGSLRTYMYNEDNKKKTLVYINADEVTLVMPFNIVQLIGRVCRTGILNDSHYRFTVANNLYVDNMKLNSYIPCVCKTRTITQKASEYSINDKISIVGHLHIRHKDDECLTEVIVDKIVSEVED